MIAKLLGFKAHAIVGAVCLAIGFGGGWKVRDLFAAKAELKAARAQNRQAAAVVQTVTKRAATTQKLGEASAEKIETIRWRTRYETKEVTKYVTLAADRACPIPVGLVRYHDAAAAGRPIPEPAGASDDAASGLELSAVAATVRENYGLYYETAERLTALQAWVREMQRAEK